jgi:uncharacterized membrane protein
MAERQSAHRIDLEKRVITADIRRSNFGLAAGLIVALAFLVGSVVLVLSGYAVEGTIFATVDIAGLVATFVYGTERRRKEREDKARTLAGFDA